jgi:chromosomal replication initiator protein
MNMHSTELMRQHQAHKERQARMASASAPVKEVNRLRDQVKDLTNEVSSLKEQLRDSEATIVTLRLDKADLQSSIMTQAERICTLEGISEQLRKPDRLSVRDIILEVLKDYPGITYDDIIGKRRTRQFMAPRHKCMVEVYQQRPDLSLPMIGKMMKRDHTTIIHAVQKHGVWRGGAE